ncbi:MAG: sulfotransferase [Planctomycetota bacterium]
MIKQVLRRLYADLVKRRTSVRVQVPSEEISCHNPIFVIGMFRSGTTLVRYLLDSHSEIACPPESRFMIYLKPWLHDDRCSGGFAALGYDKDHVRSRIRNTISYFMENYAASKGKQRWADKTPEYIDCVSFLHELYPDAKFILLFRNPVDQIYSNVHSGLGASDRLAEFMSYGSSPIEAGADYWNGKAQRILDFETKNPQSCFRLRYEDLCDQPEQQLQSLFDFLGSCYESSVLEYYRFDHDYGAEDGKVSTTRKIRRSSSSLADWDTAELAKVIAKTRPLATKLGYDSILQSYLEKIEVPS